VTNLYNLPQPLIPDELREPSVHQPDALDHAQLHATSTDARPRRCTSAASTYTLTSSGPSWYPFPEIVDYQTHQTPHDADIHAITPKRNSLGQSPRGNAQS
jgi:hypothetical protein